MTNKNVAKMPKKAEMQCKKKIALKIKGEEPKSRPPLPLTDSQSVACHWAGKNCHLSI